MNDTTQDTAVRDLWRDASDEGLGQQDFTRLYEWIRNR